MLDFHKADIHEIETGRKFEENVAEIVLAIFEQSEGRKVSQAEVKAAVERAYGPGLGLPASNATLRLKRQGVIREFREGGKITGYVMA